VRTCRFVWIEREPRSGDGQALDPLDPGFAGMGSIGRTAYSMFWLKSLTTEAMRSPG